MKSNEKYNIKYYLIVLLVLILPSCTEDNKIDGKEIYFENIAQHYLSTGEGLTEQQLVISDRESWEDLLSKMEAVNNQTQHFSREEFDFSDEILLVVLDSFRPNGGHSITISKLLESNGHLTAIVEKPEKGNASTMVMQPYHIISIEKTNKNITFSKNY